MIIGWAAWFVDVPEQVHLTAYSSKDISWEDLPKDGCLGIMLFEDEMKPDGQHKRSNLSSYDYYFRAGNIYGVDNETREKSCREDIESRYVDPVIIRGIWTDLDTMKRVEAEMREATF